MSPECTGLLLPLLLDRCHSDPACILNSAYPDRLQSQAESCLPPHPSFKVFALKLQAVPYGCQTIGCLGDGGRFWAEWRLAWPEDCVPESYRVG